MTTWIMFDNDISPAAVQRRLREEMARRGIGSDAQAAKRYGKRPQQWVSRHMNGQTDWKLQELQDFCDVLDLDYRYVAIGIRTINPPANDGNPTRNKITDRYRVRRASRSHHLSVA